MSANPTAPAPVPSANKNDEKADGSPAPAVLQTPAVPAPPGFAPLQIRIGDAVAGVTVITGTTHGVEPGTSAPMPDEFVPQKGGFESLHDVVYATFTPMEGDFAPMEDTSALVCGDVASLQDAFAPLQGA